MSSSITLDTNCNGNILTLFSVILTIAIIICALFYLISHILNLQDVTIIRKIFFVMGGNSAVNLRF